MRNQLEMVKSKSTVAYNKFEEELTAPSPFNSSFDIGRTTPMVEDGSEMHTSHLNSSENYSQGNLQDATAYSGGHFNLNESLDKGKCTKPHFFG